MIDTIRFILSTICTVLGLFVLISGIFGIFRFKYSLSRIHASALFDTAGIFLMLLGVMIATGFNVTTIKMIVVIVFLWLTSPVASHLIGSLEVTIDDDIEKHLEVLDKEMIEEQKEGK